MRLDGAAVADRAQRDGAVLRGPRARGSGERVELQPRVAIGERQAQRDRCGQRLEQAGEGVAMVVVAGRLTVAPERQVDVGRAAGLVRVGPRHERGAQPQPGGGDADRLLCEERLVGGAERVAVGDVQLQLADAVLEVRRLDPQAGALERRDDGVDEIAVERGAQAVIRVGALVQRPVGRPQVALQLERRPQLEATGRELGQPAAQCAARAERQRRAVGQDPVAEHPPVTAEPRADDRRRRVEGEQHVGIARVGARIPPAVARGRRHPVAGDVEPEQRHRRIRASRAPPSRPTPASPARCRGGRPHRRARAKRRARRSGPRSAWRKP